MHTILVCPETGAGLDFELPGNEATLRAHWAHPLCVHCPLCQVDHFVKYSLAYMTGVMSECRHLPADMKNARLH